MIFLLPLLKTKQDIFFVFLKGKVTVPVPYKCKSLLYSNSPFKNFSYFQVSFRNHERKILVRIGLYHFHYDYALRCLDIMAYGIHYAITSLHIGVHKKNCGNN